MAVFGLAQVTPVLKQYYTEKMIESLVFKSPVIGLMPKDTNAGGVNYIGAIRSAIPSFISGSDTIAFGTGGQGSTYNQWVCPYISAYAAANISGIAIDSSANNKTAFVSAVTSEADGAFLAFGQNLSAQIWGNGGGSIGQISNVSNVATTQITLTNPNQAINFWPGQVLSAATTDGTTGSPEAGTVTLAGVDIQTGVLTATGNWNTGISTISNTDYLFLSGNFDTAVQGIPAWIPVNDPASNDSFNGVNRSTMPNTLAGVRYVNNGASKKEALMTLAMYINRNQGVPTHCFLNNVDFVQVLKDLQSDVRYVDQAAMTKAQISFRGVAMATALGDIVLMQDPFVPQGFAWMVDIKTWKMASMGPVPRVSFLDDLTWLRAPTADTYQFRLISRIATYCSNPGHNGVVTF